MANSKALSLLGPTGKTERYPDCPACRGKQLDTPCTFCLIRRRQASEPDTWFYKPRHWNEARNVVSLKHASLPNRKTSDPWIDLDRARMSVHPLVYQRQVLRRAIAWGVNIDRAQVPLGAVPKRKPVPIPAFPDKPPPTEQAKPPVKARPRTSTARVGKGGQS